MNLAFEGKPVRALCPYDAGRLEPDVLAAARRAHPELVEAAAGRRVCTEYRDETLPQACRAPLGPAPAEAPSLRFGVGDLARVRSLVAEAARRAGLGVERREDLVVAVNELATNSVRHGGGAGVLRTWLEPGRLVCEVQDAGVIPDPLAGRTPPEPGGVGGRGLWLVYQLADLAQVRSGNEGTRVRLHAALDGGPAPAAAARGPLV
jgi:anti-sigma regulatory factor (Ser/Thr protein kinase)